jgi:hypothetical protein
MAADVRGAVNRPSVASLALAIAVLVVACQQPPDDVPTTMLSGLVLAGPTCPVVRDPPDPACEDRPVAGAEIIAVDAQGQEIARAITDADGGFSLALPAGEFQLVPQPVEGLLGTASPTSIVVVDGAPLEAVTIIYDTGIR